MTNGHGDQDFIKVESAEAPESTDGTDGTDGTEATLDNFASLSPEEQLAVMRNDLEEIRQESAQSRELAQRAQADLVNFRRRAEEERIAVQQDANRRLIINLLPVIDELELAINHLSDGNSAESGPAESWVEGIKLIHRKAQSLLESEGVSQIETVGVQFNPLQHEAIGVVDSAEHSPGYVVEVVRNGYRLRDRVIQAAQVVVAR
jgi:molecular chaperone GrpE